ncbi:MAG: winged helix-turn-helix domain-containing protein, partial [Caldilinea sp.]
GFTIGADDYMVKPFSPRELAARVQAALRRLERLPKSAAAQVLTSGGLRLDPSYRVATLDGLDLALTSVEFDLLYAMMRQPGRPFTRDELLTVAQTDSVDGAYERTIDVHIKNLRQKLGGAGRHSRFIETVHGVGYRFVG